jgi:hypothetical protein
MTVLLDRQIGLIVYGFFSSECLYKPTGAPTVNFYIYSVLLMIPISILHELIHGLAHIIFGGRVRFGFKWIFAYTAEVSGRPMRILEFVIILLSPLIVLSILLLPLGGWVLNTAFLLNTLGSSGDIYMAATLLKCPRGCRIVDRAYGYDVV